MSVSLSVCMSYNKTFPYHTKLKRIFFVLVRQGSKHVGITTNTTKHHNRPPQYTATTATATATSKFVTTTTLTRNPQNIAWLDNGIDNEQQRCDRLWFSFKKGRGQHRNDDCGHSLWGWSGDGSRFTRIDRGLCGQPCERQDLAAQWAHLLLPVRKCCRHTGPDGLLPVLSVSVEVRDCEMNKKQWGWNPKRERERETVSVQKQTCWRTLGHGGNMLMFVPSNSHHCKCASSFVSYPRASLFLFPSFEPSNTQCRNRPTTSGETSRSFASYHGVSE